MSKDLRQFLRVAKEFGHEFYVEIVRPLKPELEVCVIQQKLARQGRFPVIYCPEILGSKLPLVTDLFGSREMIGLSFGLDPTEVTKADIFREFNRRKLTTKLAETVPSREAPVKEVILKGEDADLGLLPIVHHALLNSGKYVTAGCMICKDPDTGVPNVGIYRHEVKGKRELGCMINPVHHAAYIARRCATLGQPMEVAIFVGHHPAVVLGAAYAGPQDVSEFEVMGGFAQESLELAEAETVSLEVPSRAEIVIEGVIDPHRMVTDGPFSEFAGYYGEEAKPCYLIEVTAITMRKDAIYHDLDPSHREHNLCGVMASESIVFDTVKAAVPTVKAVYAPPSAANVFAHYISIAKRVQGEGKRAGLAALSSGIGNNIVVVVDEDIDVYNEEEVMWAVNTRMVADRDIVIIPGITGPHLHPCSYDETRHRRGYMTSKMLIDATMPVDLPFEKRIVPPKDLWESMKLEDYIR
ncbi:MAG: UbiD family decarboxylase [Chloroflexi bacterium]|nr:UbiD family decarboxylase [Chloroflexota bacterium]